MDANTWILLGLLPGALAGAVVAWLTIRHARARDSAAAQRCEVVVIERTKQWTWMGAIFTAGPLLMLIRIVREPDPSEARGIWGMMIALCCMGGAFLIYARRKIVFSRDSIESIGVPQFRVPWTRVKAIKGNASGALTNLHFIMNDGRKIVVDATMKGWHELPPLLRELPVADVKQMAERALADLNV
jgi:hypothetical protein